MKNVSQFIFGNEVMLPLTSVSKDELYFCDFENKIAVSRKTKKGNVLVKTVNNYGELYDVEGINLEPSIPNYIFLNP